MSEIPATETMLCTTSSQNNYCPLLLSCAVGYPDQLSYIVSEDKYQEAAVFGDQIGPGFFTECGRVKAFKPLT
ncbi:hypothetical protein H920_00088 [Fukomys damarensis]|uniref:Uncharacterized protein n=1 Tax=Fukomys damarensis TaxID=885580 RepID=A0A091E558_FUKDA|nr:hypothetical protein H920_00089 [Fukomys damarensis]KFO38507.1 hypothetical protein H920_00088 [Fukomys damarensis]